jgi:putative Holliday junction resolvase
MIYYNLEEFIKLKIMGPYLGIDLGLKNSGLSISTRSLNLANSLKTIPTQDLVNELKLLYKKYAFQALIVGLPLDYNNQLTEHCDQIIKIIEKIHKKWQPLPTLFFDERYTTKIADQQLRSQNYNRRERNHMDNATASSIILNDVLNLINNYS